MASWKNRASVLQVLERLPGHIKQAIGVQLKTEVDGLTEAIKRACPVGVELEDQPGALRDSVHSYPGNRELRYVILADAKDEKKREFIGQHVEFGHINKGGAHVPAHPFFFPTYRARKVAMRSHMRAAAYRATKDWARGMME